MKLAFSTLGCPDLSLAEIIDLARGARYDGVELRAVDGTIDLGSVADLAPDRAAATAERFAQAGLEVACLDSSVRVDGPLDRSTRDEARRSLDLAARVRAPYVRVFAGRPRPGAEAITTGVAELAHLAAAAGVRVAVETHGEMSRSRDLMDALDGVSEQVGVVWDVMHTFRAGEGIAQSLALVLPRLVHVHLRDAATAGAGHDFVRTGEGIMPIAQVVEALQAAGYSGYLSFEWEKFWHPDLEEGATVIPHFADHLRSVMA
ncbi:sugar phosphate isomerase/epimerase family protein [Microbacterium sp. SSW1-59]|uniref:sugar phosphate isomerase/epimerase family protein n=1 Tax=Microbacterium xanthum TaxID=3079794 RepID=UPI002AD5172B|nr:sugar phosphate isomerase/epimerase family protein [Microbacterium sp. SSW1-59]MDZ8200347.1 sugar phosphate isomerase/epimerase family protein [Microbacterium sp. SSW1-59]